MEVSLQDGQRGDRGYSDDIQPEDGYFSGRSFALFREELHFQEVVQIAELQK